MCALSRSSLRGVEPVRKHAVFSVWQAAISPAHPAGSSATIKQKTHRSVLHWITVILPLKQINILSGWYIGLSSLQFLHRPSLNIVLALTPADVFNAGFSVSECNFFIIMVCSGQNCINTFLNKNTKLITTVWHKSSLCCEGSGFPHLKANNPISSEEDKKSHPLYIISFPIEKKKTIAFSAEQMNFNDFSSDVNKFG